MSSKGLETFADLLAQDAEVSARFNELADRWDGTKESLETTLVALGESHGCCFTTDEVKTLSEINWTENVKALRDRLVKATPEAGKTIQPSAPWSGGF